MVGALEDAHGNNAILTKVDKLRELVGAKVSLPQLVVAGDQSSGKSSVLEGLTGFAFPRDAELCTRYATQITCRREGQVSITVSIIPSADATPAEQQRVKGFRRTLVEMTPEGLANIFKEANEALGIRTSTRVESADGTALPAFSEHILKIEKIGPREKHFTVIDVPGIFREETEGITRESDIELVRNMVKSYMKDSRTIILAIMPCNVDPATQEILKLAKQADPQMTRTMAVLTKPDLAIEQTIKQIAIDHVRGKRGSLKLGYYIVKNRGSDDTGVTLEEGQAQEKQFFTQEPWSVLSRYERAGINNLKVRVHGLLVDLIKREFPKLKAELVKEVQGLKASLNKLGPSRSDESSQRAYLSKISEAFQKLARDALSASYTSEGIFSRRHDLRLATRVVEVSERFGKCIETHGHTWAFKEGPKNDAPTTPGDPDTGDSLQSFLDIATAKGSLGAYNGTEVEYSELDEFLLGSESELDELTNPPVQGIMDYIEKVYEQNRAPELGTFRSTDVATLFKEQSRKWVPITLAYAAHVILMVHHFIAETMREVCPESKVLEQLWDSLLVEELQKVYAKAMENAQFLLRVEREESHWTLNHYFNDNLQKAQNSRLVESLKTLGMPLKQDGGGFKVWLPREVSEAPGGIYLNPSCLGNLATNKANPEHVREYLHDALRSFYKVSRKRFVDVVYQQTVNHFLLQGPDSPLRIFTTDMVLRLNPEQLDMIAGEDAAVTDHRNKLTRDIESFNRALKVLRGSD